MEAREKKGCVRKGGREGGREAEQEGGEETHIPEGAANEHPGQGKPVPPLQVKWPGNRGKGKKPTNNG